ncbi:TPA: hypothetical protein HA335_02965 [Methanocaldococcus jannaschii]|uniref:Uncharacterized protein n=1 Tax=Methanocaldococcus jannaschii TaxID=2190 RepID=A0A832T5R3_9EURY|nr:hypothetical protein [Methanocaldococcus jannaschii]
MIIAGTMPIKGLDLTIGKPILKGDKIINNKEFPISMEGRSFDRGCFKNFGVF